MYQITVDFNDGHGNMIYNTIPFLFDKAVKELVDLVRHNALIDSKSDTYTYNIVEIKD
jgi:hypothetical protein